MEENNLNNKRILHITFSDDCGGAAIAAYRLHKSMLDNGLDSKMLVFDKRREDNTIFSFYKGNLEMLLYKFKYYFLSGKTFLMKPELGCYSTFHLGSNIINNSLIKEADIIYLHWICRGVLSRNNILQILKTNKKVIWVMHDMFPITGGCHHSLNCTKYSLDCAECMFFKKNKNAIKQLKEKKTFLKYSNMYWVAPSKWLYNCAKESSVVDNSRLFLIPNQISLNFFQLEKDFSKEALGINRNKFHILFGADGVLNNPYKGFNYFIDTIKYLFEFDDIKKIKDKIEVLIFGMNYNETVKQSVPFNLVFLGVIKDERTMNLVYNSSNIMMITSKAENYPLTVQECAACKTPVFGFDIGGISDIIDNPKKGKLVSPFDTFLLASSIREYICNEERYLDSVDNKKTYNEIVKKHYKLFIE